MMICVQVNTENLLTETVVDSIASLRGVLREEVNAFAGVLCRVTGPRRSEEHGRCECLSRRQKRLVACKAYPGCVKTAHTINTSWRIDAPGASCCIDEEQTWR